MKLKRRRRKRDYVMTACLYFMHYLGFRVRLTDAVSAMRIDGRKK